MQHSPLTRMEWTSIYRAMKTARSHDDTWDDMDTHTLGLVKERLDDADADHLLRVGKARFVHQSMEGPLAHNDQDVSVVRRLSASEKSVKGLGPQPVLEILAEDGWRGLARVEQLIAKPG